MRQKDLEILLTQLESFSQHKIELEQYQTPPRIAAMILWRAFQLGDIKNKKVSDYCCGTGIFSIGAKLLGAKKVVGIDIDSDAIQIAKLNSIKLDTKIKFIQKDIRKNTKVFDTVLMNSPFGIQGSIKDQEFLEIALKTSSVTYSIHLYQESNLDFLTKFVQQCNKKIDEIIKAEFEIPKIYEFHTKEHHVIEVAILRCI